MTAWVYDDRGRAAAGFKGEAEDCAARAIAIATAMDYRTVYKMVDDYGAAEPGRGRHGGIRESTAEGGVFGPTTRRIMVDLGWRWMPTMGRGVGLRADELPAGRILAELDRHSCAVIDGVIHDICDPSRDGTRCVYGVYLPPGNTWDGLAIEPVRDRPETGIPAFFYTREEPCDPDRFVAGDPGAFWLEAGVDLIGAGVDLRVVCLDGGTFLAAGLSVEAARRLAEQLLDAAQEAATFVLPEIS